jgi:site-specific DNA-methyltransferase (adenine-specific)
MLDSTNFQYLVDFPNAAEMFPGVDISGGICYFLWDEKYDGKCEVKTFQNGEISSTFERFLGEHGEVFVRFNEALPILDKVRAKANTFLNEQVSSSKPFGFRTFFNDFAKTKSAKNIKIMTKDGVFEIRREQLTVNEHWLDKYKVTVAKAYGERGSYPYLITSKPKILPPNMVCTETYQVCGVFDTLREAENFADYIRTRFFRFLVGLLKNTQDLSKNKFQFVPILDMKKHWDDDKLFKLFDISDEEQQFISSMIREMPKVED